MNAIIIFFLVLFGGVLGFIIATNTPDFLKKKKWETVETCELTRTVCNPLNNFEKTEDALFKLQILDYKNKKYIRGRIILENGKEKNVSLSKIYMQVSEARNLLIKYGYKI